MEKAMKLIKTLIAALLLTAGVAHADGVDLTPADCTHAKKAMEAYNAKVTNNPEYRRTFEDKATYAYALACQSAGLIDIPMYLTQAPEASKEVREYCADNARSRGEAERCLVSGKLDSEQ